MEVLHELAIPWVYIPVFSSTQWESTLRDGETCKVSKNAKGLKKVKTRRLSRGKSHFDQSLWEISLCVSYPLHNRHRDKYGCQKEWLQMLTFTSSFSEFKANIMLLTYWSLLSPPPRFLISLALFPTRAHPWKHTHWRGVRDSRNQSVFTYELLIRQLVVDNMKIT